MCKNLFLVSSILLFSCAGFASGVKIGSGGAPMQNIFQKIKDPFEKASKVSLELVKVEPATGFEKVDKGEIDAACVAFAFKEWVEKSAKDGYVVKDEKAYSSRIIGRDNMYIMVTPDTKVTKLGKDQAVALLTGTAKNWKEVGGADLPITFIHGNNTPGQDSRIIKKLMPGQKLGGNMIEVPSAEISDKLKATKGGYSFGPKAQAQKAGAVEVELEVDISSPITIITKGEPSENVKKVIDYIAKEGFNLIVK